MPNLTPAARAVAAWLVWHTNASTGRCDPGQSRLQRETGLSPRSIQYAIKELLLESVVSRQLRGSRSTSYQISWETLSRITQAFEARAKDNVQVVVPSERSQRGRKSLRIVGAKDCVSPEQKIAPELLERNLGKEPVFPVGIIAKANDASEASQLALKILQIKADAAFLAALDRETKRGHLFEPAVAEALYLRLERIHSDNSHIHGDPLAGRANRLLETQLDRERMA